MNFGYSKDIIEMYDHVVRLRVLLRPFIPKRVFIFS